MVKINENNGSKPYEQMDDLGVPLFLETPIFETQKLHSGEDPESYTNFFFCIRFPSLKLTANALKIGHPKRKRSHSKHPFLGANLLFVSGG